MGEQRPELHGPRPSPVAPRILSGPLPVFFWQPEKPEEPETPTCSDTFRFFRTFAHSRPVPWITRDVVHPAETGRNRKSRYPRGGGGPLGRRGGPGRCSRP